MPRLVFISDTHLQHDFSIPDGDVLFHCGDLTWEGSISEIRKAAMWLKSVRIGGGFRDVVVTPGNHDWLAERDPDLMRTLITEAGCTYLHHKPAVVQGMKVFCSGYTPAFYDWALNVKRGPELARLWAQIPDDTEVLVTHGPPYGRLDEVQRSDESDYGVYGREPIRYIKENVGCKDLKRRIEDLKQLKVHAFGHIHRPGIEIGADKVTYINAAICNEDYKPVHPARVLDL